MNDVFVDNATLHVPCDESRLLLIFCQMVRSGCRVQILVIDDDLIETLLIKSSGNCRCYRVLRLNSSSVARRRSVYFLQILVAVSDARHDKRVIG